MWSFTLGLTVSFVLANNYLLNFLAFPIRYFHYACLRFTPLNSEFKNLYAAMVCGAELPPTSFREDLQILGLYHLMVVSGSHFLVLEILFSRLSDRLGRGGAVALFVLLTIFAWMCRWEPPVFRAWLSFLLRQVNQERKLFWQGHHLSFATGIVCLVLFPEWIMSLSFLLSWLAALLVSLPFGLSWRRHAFIYIGLLPVVYGLQPLHPATILVNWIFAPVIGGGLFPLCLMAMILPFTVPLTDLIWSGVTMSLGFLAAPFPASGRTSFSALYLPWLYLLALHVGSFLYLVRKHRS